MNEMKAGFFGQPPKVSVQPIVRVPMNVAMLRKALEGLPPETAVMVAGGALNRVKKEAGVTGSHVSLLHLGEPV